MCIRDSWYAEVEYPTVEAANAWQPAAWGLAEYLSDEVTGQPGQSMGAYWLQTLSLIHIFPDGALDQGDGGTGKVLGTLQLVGVALQRQRLLCREMCIRDRRNSSRRPCRTARPRCA